MKIDIFEKENVVKASRILKINATVRDSGDSQLFIDNKKVYGISEDNGFPGLNQCINGEDLNLEIDIDTGNIINWKVPKDKVINEMIEEEKEFFQEKEKKRNKNKKLEYEKKFLPFDQAFENVKKQLKEEENGK